MSVESFCRGSSVYILNRKSYRVRLLSVWVSVTVICKVRALITYFSVRVRLRGERHAKVKQLVFHGVPVKIVKTFDILRSV